MKIVVHFGHAASYFVRYGVFCLKTWIAAVCFAVGLPGSIRAQNLVQPLSATLAANPGQVPGIAVDDGGNIFAVVSNQDVVIEITPGGAVSTLGPGDHDGRVGRKLATGGGIQR